MGIDPLALLEPLRIIASTKETLDAFICLILVAVAISGGLLIWSIKIWKVRENDRKKVLDNSQNALNILKTEYDKLKTNYDELIDDQKKKNDIVYTRFIRGFEGILTYIEKLGRNQQIMKADNTDSYTMFKNIRDEANLLVYDLSDLNVRDFPLHKKMANVVTNSIHPIIGQLSSTAKNKGITINFDSNTVFPSFPYDIDRMNSAVYELLKNAIEYSDRNQSVNISLTCDSHKNYEISFHNYGLCIELDEIPSLFVHSFRGRNASKYKPDGFGGGLKKAFDIINQHNGILKLTHSGHPTTFTIVFKISDAH